MFWQKHGVDAAASSQNPTSGHLDDTALVELEPATFITTSWASIFLVLCGICSLCETPGRSYGAENVTTASIEMVVNSKWEKSQFWVSYSFKVQSY